LGFRGIGVHSTGKKSFEKKIHELNISKKGGGDGRKKQQKWSCQMESVKNMVVIQVLEKTCISPRDRERGITMEW
jgi:hypothetical protein